MRFKIWMFTDWQLRDKGDSMIVELDAPSAYEAFRVALKRWPKAAVTHIDTVRA